MTEGSSSSGTPLTVSVVVCAYTVERWPQVRAAVASAVDQTRPADEVLLVVDHNRELLDLAQSLSGVRVLASEGAKGLSGARNTGVRHAVGDVVAFLDDDAVASPDWLARTVAAYDPEVLGTGGQVRAAWPQGGRPGWFPTEFDWVVGCSYTGLPTGRAVVRNPIGANMSFRRDVLLSTGGFSERLGRVGTLPVGCEETELAIRARAQVPGGVVVLEPAAAVDHHVSVPRTSPRYFVRRCWSEGISKSQVARLAGRDDALESERGYVVHTLLRGVVRHLLDLFRHRDPWGPARAAAIAVGLSVTVSGYAWGTVASGRRTDQGAQDVVLPRQVQLAATTDRTDHR